MDLFIDFETYFDSQIKYDLKHISVTEYIRDPRFKVFGAGIAFNGDPVKWLNSKELNVFFKRTNLQNCTIIGHNIKFDGAILAWHYNVLAGQWIDTKGMSRAVLGKSIKNHSLATLAEHFKLESKGHLNTNGKLTLTPQEEKELADYCIHDVELCREIFDRLVIDFPTSEYSIMDQTIKMFVQPKLKLNVPLLRDASVEEAKRRANIFAEIGIDKSVFASNVKFPVLLSREGYEVPTKESPRKKDEQGNSLKIPALALGDPDFLELMENGDERLKTLCEARIAAKSTLLETRSAKLASIGQTGNWPFDVEFSGADQTHRFSGGSGAGGNPQNFTRGSVLRKAVEAPEGFELIVGDFSNIELRIQAYLSKDPGLIEAIEKNRDIYCDFASAFYGKTITKADEKERRFGKTAILGLGYGMGWLKFIKTVRLQTGETISEEQSRKAVDLYRTRYNQIPELWKKLDSYISKLCNPEGIYQEFGLPVKFVFGELLLPSGLKIRFPNLRRELGERNQPEWIYDVYTKGHLEKRKLYGGKVLENICQGLAGEICKDSMRELEDLVVGQVHDELLILSSKGLLASNLGRVKRAMTNSPSWLKEMKLDAEVGHGTNWLEAK